MKQPKRCPADYLRPSHRGQGYPYYAQETRVFGSEEDGDIPTQQEEETLEIAVAANTQTAEMIAEALNRWCRESAKALPQTSQADDLVIEFRIRRAVNQ